MTIHEGMAASISEFNAYFDALTTRANTLALASPGNAPFSETPADPATGMITLADPIRPFGEAPLNDAGGTTPGTPGASRTRQASTLQIENLGNILGSWTTSNDGSAFVGNSSLGEQIAFTNMQRWTGAFTGSLVYGDIGLRYTGAKLVLTSNIDFLNAVFAEVGAPNISVNGTTLTIAGDLLMGQALFLLDSTAIPGTDFGDITITVNLATNNPPSLSLSASTGNLREDSDTTSTTYLADISVVDDIYGTNTRSLAGPDAASFVIVGGNQLHLAAGVSLNYATKNVYNVAVQVNDDTVGATPDDSESFTLHVTKVTPTLHVVDFAPVATGVRFILSQTAVIATGLNLYDYRDPGGAFVLGSSDLQLTNGAGQAIPGSLVVDATGTQFSFVATAGRLPADTYTLTLRSAANGFRTAQGDLLDGNGDGTTGDNFTTTFTVAAPPANAVTVSVPHFARGPEQSVNTPTTSALGLPINVSDGANLTGMQFDLSYDVGLLAVTNVALVGGGTATLTPLGAGQVRVALTFSAPLSAGPRTVAYLSASVPSAAASRYGERGVLDISNILLTSQGGGSVPGLDQDAVQINTYFGDVGRNGRYDSFDVQQTSRLALDLDTGFQQHPLTDPVLLADFNGNGRIDSFDTQRVSRLALNLPVTEAADLPNPLPTVTDTDRVVAADPSKLAALRSDVDANGSVDAQDVLWAVYYFGESANGTPPSENELKRLDINTDGLFDPADILLMVTDLDPKAAAAEGESTTFVGDLGEQDELDALAYLLATDLTNGRKKLLA